MSLALRKGLLSPPHRPLPFLVLLLAASLLWACGPSDPGERVWVRKCAGCHGREGRGKARYLARFPYADLTDGKYRHGTDRASVLKMVADGGIPASPMPPFRERLSREELDSVVGLVLRIYAGTAFRPTPAASPGATAPPS